MDIIAGFIRKIVFPLMEKRKGNNIRLYLGELKSSQSLPPEEFNTLQTYKLKQLLSHCIDNVPAYKPLSDLRDKISEDPMAALRMFPVLTKETFKKNPSLYLSDNAKNQSLIPNQTGGSTGVPVKFYIDRKTVEFYEAARYRGLSWNGVEVGDRSVMIWGNPLELNKQKDFIYRMKERFLKNRIVIPAFSLNPESLERYVMRIRRYKPKFIYGYLSSLYAFASLMLKENIKIGVKLIAVVSTSETLHDFQRQVIEKAFDCSLSNEYGARDGGIIAYSCSHGRMHISAENMIFETIDVISQRSVKPGEMGAVLVTDLNNLVMPRIRYKLGDLAVISQTSCDCGINLPVIEKLQGREDDIFLAKDGTLVHSEYFTYIARSLDGIKQFQMLQHTPDSVTFTIVKTDEFKEESAKLIVNSIRDKLGVTDIKLIYSDEIPVEGSGKYRFTKREFPLDVLK